MSSFCSFQFAQLIVHYPSLLSCMKTAFVINGKIKKFPSLLSPESIEDTAFDAVSSKLADKPGRVSQF